jgi:hypothetical protein
LREEEIASTVGAVQYGWTSEETIIQEHGIGPLTVNYPSPAHGPQPR